LSKYLETAKIMFKQQIAYRFDTLLSMLFTISKILLAYVLWGAIFSEQEVVSGFTFHTMLSYYIISSFITQLDQSSKFSWQLAHEIRNGIFSKYLVRPMGIFRYFSAQAVGVSAYLITFNFIAALLWVVVFRINFQLTQEPQLWVYAILLVLLGLLFMMQLNYYIGILAFHFLDTSLFMMIKENLVQFITGALIPLTLLPESIVSVMSYFPFYAMTYLPTMLLLGRHQEEALFGLFILFMWNLLLGIVTQLTYQHYRVKYDGVGI
jgi:ABC-2 type transport system permease protein